MFTGIVRGAFPVVDVSRLPGLLRIAIALPTELRIGLEIGASVSVDGVCLTVTSLRDEGVCFDIMQQTLTLTTLDSLAVGQRVNVERSATQGAEIGGHCVSGHVDGTAEVVAIESPANNRFVRYRLPADKMKYVFNKGFVSLNGCSLTVADVDAAQHTIQVCFIPETLRATTHGEKRVGDAVNFEVDRQTQAIVDTVEKVLAERLLSR